ncbi:YibE/F family protein [Corynebacterium cystitidis]|uniref:YibE/F family protein n=1 Tax=Corynebacterium cystitidis TaxID=35757 RepID=UPI00211E061D|nr:YibE/F family protein [Corynebacterium cystitidis]
MGRHAVKEERSPFRVGLLAGLAAALVGTLIGLVLLWPPSTPPTVAPEFSTTFALNHPQVKGTIELVDDRQCSSPSTGQAFEESPEIVRNVPGEECQRALVRITNGVNEGKRTALVSHPVPGNPTFEEGAEIRMVESTQEDGSKHYSFADYQRTPVLLMWAVVVALAVVAFAWWRGARALLGLVVSLLVIVVFLLPALLHGGAAVPLAVVAGAAIMFMTVPLVHGINWKSAATLGGTLIALGLAAWLADLAIRTTNLRGLGDDDNLTILLYLPDVSITGLMLCGFIIGALGGLNDVSISQASTVNELSQADPDLGPWQLFTSAMRVGQDHIASMVYTLVLTYVGAALPLLLLVTVSEASLIQVLTNDIVATELLRSAVGALGLTLAVPITTLIAAWTVRSEPATAVK